MKDLFTLKVFNKQYPALTKDSLTIDVDGINIKTLAQCYALFAKKLQFPAYFDNNLDAFYDTLIDLAWLREQPVNIIITNFDDWLEQEEDDLKIRFLFTLTDAGETWLNTKQSEAFFNLYVQQSNTLNEILETCELNYISINN